MSKASLRQAFQDCRQSTIALFETLSYETFCQQVHPDFSPVGWHLGHIGYTEALWILQRCAGLPPLFPEYHKLFAQDGLAKSDRVHLPPIAEVFDYLATIRSKVFNYLEHAPLDHQERIWQWLLQHESQHLETVTIVLELIKKSSGDRSSQVASIVCPAIPNELIYIPTGPFTQGCSSIDAIDNERPPHTIHLDAYAIDRFPVTQSDYRSFIKAGGYDTEAFWSAEGWHWKQTNQITEPLYWKPDRAFDHHPVNGVSWYEADAYARSLGKRLPTEAEWEKAASWNPIEQTTQRYPWGNTEPTDRHCNHHAHYAGTTAIDRFPKGRSAIGCEDMLSNVWEWTDTWFDGYPGFEPFPYPGYSQAYFDRAHRVLKGGSWATRKWALRNSFRNWYYPQVREVFAGFRCATSEINMTI